MKKILGLVFLALVLPCYVFASGLSNVTVTVPANYLNLSNNNIAFGPNGLAAVTTGTQNLVFGINSGMAITVGQQNIIMGNGSGANLTIGNYNLILNSGETNLVSGQYNIIEGYTSDVYSGTTQNAIAIGGPSIAGSDDTALGVSALAATATDFNANTAIGFGALGTVTTGCCNSAVGYLAGGAIKGASTKNTFVGYGAGSSAGSTGVGNGTNSNLTVIGYNVGSTTLSNGSNNILIGVSSAIDVTATSASNEIHIGGTGGDWVKVTGANTQATQAGSLYGTMALPNIATDATHTDATICEDTTTHILYFGSGTLGICLGTSSARYKKDIQNMPDGLEQIMGLRAVNFYFKEKTHGDINKKQYGFIAEEGMKVIPDLVSLDKDGKPNTFDYLGLVPVLVHAVQEQQKEIDELKRGRK